MKLVLLGLSHRSAPVSVRERYAVEPGATRALDEKLVHHAGVDEAALISTCNRTELVAVCHETAPALEGLARFLRDEVGDGSAAADHIYELRDTEVVRHVFRVAASLDSMVVGEAQILGQLKDAYRAALEAQSCGPVLNRLFQHAFRAAKRIRSETGLGGSQVSLARIGVQLAREIFESFEGKRVLVLGAGEMAESALAGLRDAGVRDVVVVNRTLEVAVGLAERVDAVARPLEAPEDELCSVDIALCSVHAPKPVLAREVLARVAAARAGQPLLLVDLGLPRNVDPAAQELSNVYLYDIDDLEEVAARGRAQRVAAMEPAESIVRSEADRFERWRTALPLVPTIVALRERAEALALAEVRRAAAGLRGAADAPPEALERLAQAIVAKILHRPFERLRDEAEEGAVYYREATRHLFGLEEDDE